MSATAYAIETGERTAVAPVERFTVKYFDAAASRARKGGVRVAGFTDRAAAEAFAAKHHIYAAPCRVDVEVFAYEVRFCDAAPGEKFKTSNVARFLDRKEAEKFASQHRLYSKPCSVEVAR